MTDINKWKEDFWDAFYALIEARDALWECVEDRDEKNMHAIRCFDRVSLLIRDL